MQKRTVQNITILNTSLRPTAEGCRVQACKLYNPGTCAEQPSVEGQRNEYIICTKSIKHLRIFNIYLPYFIQLS